MSRRRSARTPVTQRAPTTTIAGHDPTTIAYDSIGRSTPREASPGAEPGSGRAALWLGERGRLGTRLTPGAIASERCKKWARRNGRAPRALGSGSPARGRAAEGRCRRGLYPRSHGSERSFVRRRTRFRRSTRGGRRLCRGDCRSEAGCRAGVFRVAGLGDARTWHRPHARCSERTGRGLVASPAAPSGGRHDARFSHQPARGVRKISGAAAQREVIPAVGARIVGSRRHEPWCRGRPPPTMGGAHHRAPSRHHGRVR